MRRSLGREPADVVLAHGGAALQVAAVGGRGLPLVHQLIMGMPIHDRGRLWHLWWGRLLGRCAAVVSLTDALTDEVRTLGYRGPVELIANARSTARFDGLSRADEAARLRAELGLEPEVPLLGFVGHLVAQKRPDVAVEVADRLRTLGVDAHLVVVGGGPLAADVAAQVERLDLAHRVSLLGHRPDVARVLGGVDLLVLPSDSEGMPGVAIEAQMARCPVVAFPVGGVAEVVATGESGLVLSDRPRRHGRGGGQPARRPRGPDGHEVRRRGCVRRRSPWPRRRAATGCSPRRWGPGPSGPTRGGPERCDRDRRRCAVRRGVRDGWDRRSCWAWSWP